MGTWGSRSTSRLRATNAIANPYAAYHGAPGDDSGRIYSHQAAPNTNPDHDHVPAGISIPTHTCTSANLRA